MEGQRTVPRRRTEDAGGAVRAAVLEQRLDPDAATRWLLGLSKVAQDRRARFGAEQPRRRVTDLQQASDGRVRVVARDVERLVG